MSVSQAEHDELCCVYAGLLLFDDKIDITADKINKIIEASGNKVEAYYPEFFAKYLASRDINALLNASASSAAGQPWYFRCLAHHSYCSVDSSDGLPQSTDSAAWRADHR